MDTRGQKCEQSLSNEHLAIYKTCRNAANMTQEQLAAKLQLDGIMLACSNKQDKEGYRYNGSRTCWFRKNWVEPFRSLERD